MRLQYVTRNLARWTYSQRWLDEVAAGGSTDVLLLQEVLSSMIVPKGYTALPGDLLPQRHQGHRRTVTLVADKHTEAVESASVLLPELLGDVAQVRLAPPGGTGPTGRSTRVIGN